MEKQVIQAWQLENVPLQMENFKELVDWTGRAFAWEERSATAGSRSSMTTMIDKLFPCPNLQNGDFNERDRHFYYFAFTHVVAGGKETFHSRLNSVNFKGILAAEAPSFLPNVTPISERKFIKSISLFVKAENLTNRDYEPND